MAERLSDADVLLEDLTPEQRDAVTTSATPLCIVAGAGSGKTRVLTRRIAWQAATGTIDPRRVLAVTFTRRAAGELRRRTRALGLRDFRVYRELVESEEPEELGALINALTTNVTSFFREPHHFEFLKDTVIASFVKRSATQPRLRIWSAGCSTGEEPYTIGMTLRANIPARSMGDVRILATDLDTDVLDKASQGVYRTNGASGIPPQLLKENFLRGKGDREGWMRVRPELRDLVTFRQLNLIQPPYPFKGPFDVIFCRNVVIYFDKPTQTELFRRFAGFLAPGGYLCIGHSETVADCSDVLAGVGRAVYRRV